MLVLFLVGLAIYAIQSNNQPKKVEEPVSTREPSVKQRTFTAKNDLPYVPDPVNERPNTHTVNGLAEKAKKLEHAREVADMQTIKASYNFQS